MLLILALVSAGFACARAADETQAAGTDPAAAEVHPPAGERGDSHGKLKPELPMDFQQDLALWSAITFLVFLWVLKKIAWEPLLTGMATRESKIRQDIHDAEANRQKAVHLLKEYEAKLGQVQEEVRGILAEARRDADVAKQEILATAERESSAMRQRAVADIERARDQALGELFGFVSQNVIQATEQVVGRSLNGADQERLVREALANLELRKN
jgi:F-type H+-transporting ATPase subunit b